MTSAQMPVKNLVIVGGGFAGITLAQRLEHKLPPGWKLTLVSQENFITYNPLLPEVVGASIMPGHVVAPLRQMIHCSSVCMAQVSEIDLETRTLHYLGEGYMAFWFDGRVHSADFNEDEEPDGPRWQIVSRPESEWWVEVRTPDGATGWSKETDKFDHMDACE